MVFPFELIGGRRIAQTAALSPVADCLPSRILVIDTLAELALVPIGYWVYRLPESRQAPK